ncbi:MAG: hypothetical protein DYG90_00380 [Chloroflexi bacterium CFX6]|nr:hypothetical protein [Chloroflexi bacterium CFX6]
MMLKTNPATHAEEIEIDGQWFTSDDDLGHVSMMSSAFLAAIAQGKIDMPQLAREMLSFRGHDETGKWVGFAAAKAALDRPKTRTRYNRNGRAVKATIPEA